MALSTPSPRRAVHAAMAASALATLLAGPGCIDLIGADINKYVEREEKRFSTSGTPDVALSTFDGSIEIRAWDKPEVEVIVEKRASSKEVAQQIEIHTQQNGNRGRRGCEGTEGDRLRFSFLEVGKAHRVDARHLESHGEER